MKLRYVAYSIKKASDGSRVKYYYYRRPNQPPIALGADPQTVRERHRILEMQYAAAATVAVRQVGTVGELVMRFYESSAWADLSASTQALWRLAFKTLEDRFGDFPPAAITKKVTHAFKEKMVKSGDGPGTIRNRVAAWRRLWNWSISEAAIFAGENPWIKIGSLGKSKHTRPGRIWEPEHVDAFLNARRSVKIGGNPALTDPNAETEATTPPPLRLALLLGLASTQRLGDVLRLTGRNIVARNGRYWLSLKQSKTGTEVSFPILSIAEREIRAQKIEPADSRYLIRSKNGLPFDTRGFAKRFRLWTAAANLPHTFKDLRSSGMVWLSRAGADATQIVSLSGHSIDATQSILDVYIKRNEKSAQIAVDLLERAIRPTAEALAPPATPSPAEPQRSRRVPRPRA
ncbi:MAG: tyrosine-type recombinase/integrase [Azospirillum sp.]|nr:tyrosine-type recombinase/integrase [Azospirillum sp.]